MYFAFSVRKKNNRVFTYISQFFSKKGHNECRRPAISAENRDHCFSKSLLIKNDLKNYVL